MSKISYEMEEPNVSFVAKFGIGTAIIIVIILLLFIFSVGLINVEPTEVAVEIDKVGGVVKDEPLGVGYHLYNRWKTDLVTYNVATRSYPQDVSKSEESEEYSLELKTNDGQNVFVDLTVIYSLRSKEVPTLHKTVGKRYEEQILLPQIKSEGRLVIGGYSAEELYQGKVRQTIQDNLSDKLSKVLEQYPAIQINNALIRHLSFSKDFESKIEEKKLAAQQVEINKNKALAQEQEALRTEAEAKGQRLRAVQEATGRAESAKVEADAERYKLEQEAAGTLAKLKAEAEGKRLLTEALGGGDNVVALKFAENIPNKLQIWGVPTGNNSNTFMDLNGMFGGMFKQPVKIEPTK